MVWVDAATVMADGMERLDREDGNRETALAEKAGSVALMRRHGFADADIERMLGVRLAPEEAA